MKKQQKTAEQNWIWEKRDCDRSLPPEIGQLTHLQSLVLWGNELRSLPTEIGQLTHLRFLYLSRNQLSSLPPEIGQLISLRSLDLRFNQLSRLPAEVGQLTHLKSLDLSFNELSSLSAEIGQLTHLQTLDLSFNQLSNLPANIRQLTTLTKLDLRKNPIPISPEILGSKDLSEDPGDVNEILDFYFRIQDSNQTELLYEAKLLIHQIHQFFLSERSLYALVADTRKENTDFYYWLKVIELLSDNSPVLIIQNEKDDLFELPARGRSCQVNDRQLRGEFDNLKEVLMTNLGSDLNRDIC